MVSEPTDAPRKFRDRLLEIAYALVRTEKDGFDGSLRFLETADQIIQEIEVDCSQRLHDRPARASSREAEAV